MSEADHIPTETGHTTGEEAESPQATTRSAPAELRRMDRRQARSRRRAAIASKIATGILAVVVIAAVLLLTLSAFANSGRPFIGGYRPLIVLSGSMEPAMPIGSLVLTKAVDPRTVRPGDIVTYAMRSGNGADSELFVTHRVVRVTNQGGTLTFVTKGDANDSPDSSPVTSSQVVGRVALIIPYVGYLSNFVHSLLGLILLVFLPAVILIAWEVVDLVRGRKKVAQAAKVLALTLCLFGATQLAFASPAPADSTMAYFTSADEMHVNISAGFWLPSLSCTVGKAKAERHDRTPATAPIASVGANGKLSLDFGEIPAGNSNDSPDVFEITNNAKFTEKVTVSTQGAFAAFVDSISLGKAGSIAQLAAGEQEPVTIKLDVPTGTTAGDYTGTVTVAANDGSTPMQIPALVTITAKGNKNGSDQAILLIDQTSTSTTSDSTSSTLPASTSTSTSSTDTTAAPTTETSADSSTDTTTVPTTETTAAPDTTAAPTTVTTAAPTTTTTTVPDNTAGTTPPGTTTTTSAAGS